MKRKKLVTLPIMMFACLGAITLTGCFDVPDIEDTGDVNNRVASVRWTCEDTMTIFAGDKIDLKTMYEITVTGQASKDVGFISSKPNTAGVANGICTGIKAGTTTIRVYSIQTPSIFDTFTLTVEKEPPHIESVSWDVETYDMSYGFDYIYNLEVAVTCDARGGASDKVTFTTSDSEIVAIKQFYDPETQESFKYIEGMKKGEATITATSTFDPTKSASFKAIVHDPEVVSIKWVNPTIDACIGQSINMLSYLNIETLYNPLDYELRFTCEDYSIADFDGTIVNCLTDGEVYLDVYLVGNDEIHDQCILQIVEPPKILSLTISESLVTYSVNDETFSIDELITITYEGDITLIPVLNQYDLFVDEEGIIEITNHSSGKNIKILKSGVVEITVQSSFDSNFVGTITVIITE